MQILFLFIIGSVFSLACSDEETMTGLNSADSSAVKIITITDQDGYDWDITHAVQRYHWDPDLFRFGLGIGRIKPINNPQFFLPGDMGYPDSLDTFMVLGVEIEGDPRAYALSILKSREIVNDQFGEHPVAVAY